MPPDIKKFELGSSNQEASSSAGKNTEKVLWLWCHDADGSVPLQLFLVVWVFLRSVSVICHNR